MLIETHLYGDISRDIERAAAGKPRGGALKIQLTLSVFRRATRLRPLRPHRPHRPQLPPRPARG